MSSTHPLSSSSSEPKKKFGKNLNKLTKPPTPSLSATVPSTSRTGVSGSTLSSRNGLHLLSTKRSNTIGTSSGSGGGSLLGAKPKLSVSSSFSQSNTAKSAPRPLNTPSLRSESSNDLLSSAGAGSKNSGITGWGSATINDVGSSAPPQPAWGLAEKETQQTTPITTTSLAPKGRVSAGYHASIVPPSTSNTTPSNLSQQHRSDHIESSNTYHDRNNTWRQRNFRSSRWVGSDNMDGEDNFSSRTPETFQHDYRSQNRNDSSKSHYASPMPKAINDDTKSNSRLSENIQSSRRNEETTNTQHKEEKNIPKNVSTHESNISNSFKQEQNHSLKESNTITESKKTTVSVNALENQNAPSVSSESKSLGLSISDQVEYMKRRARERAEERKAEEEARMNEQKDRAARRLKELEDKMSLGNVDDSKQTSKYEDFKSEKRTEKINWRNQHSKTGRTGADYSLTQQSSEIVLERLGRPSETKSSSADAKKTNEISTVNNAGARKLFDPTRSYSSLLGGAITQKPAAVNKSTQQRTPSPPPVLQISLQHSSKDQYHINGNSSDVANNAAPPLSVIQLTSYEDRDRGQRNMSSGPRMLFDPKSGSMIHAPSLDKRSMHHYSDDTVQGGKGRKERSKQKSRGRDRDNKLDNNFSKRPDANASTSGDDFQRRRKQSDDLDDNGETKNNRRHRKKEDSNGQRKDRKRVEKESKYYSPINDQPENMENSYMRAGSTTEGNIVSSHNSSKRHGNRNTQGRQPMLAEGVKMPRTRGVLYKVDESGNYVCADGCEADQGYGAHSVPGGRIRNPSAHAQLLGQHQRFQQTLIESLSKFNDNEQLQTGERQFQHKGYTKAMTNGIFIPAQAISNNHVHERYDFSNTGEYNYHQINIGNTVAGSMAYSKHQQHRYQPNHIPSTTNEKEKEDTSKSETEKYEIPAQLRVKANETLSILSGVPDSPELQATAHPWAPSEAALAAAAANSSVQINSAPTLQRQDSDESESSHNVTAEMMRIIDESEDDLDPTNINNNTSFSGLGFDPTENMDSMMMSPTMDSTNINDVAKITQLSLEPTDGKSSSNLFAPLGTPSQFLGSSTWGTSGSLSRSPGVDPIGGLSMRSLNWDMLGTTSRDSASKIQVPSNNGNQQMNTASSFLSLSPLPVNQDGGTWGTSGFGGGIAGSLGSAQLGNAQTSNDGSNGTE